MDWLVEEYKDQLVDLITHWKKQNKKTKVTDKNVKDLRRKFFYYMLQKHEET